LNLDIINLYKCLGGIILGIIYFHFPSKVADRSPALLVVSGDSFDVDIKHLVVDVKFGVVKDKIWDSCEILSVWLEWEMVLMDLTLREIFSIFVLHTLPEFVLKAPAFQRRGFLFLCIYLCQVGGGDFELMWWRDEMIFEVLPYPIKLICYVNALVGGF
jgi:hypothetical protein